MIKVLFSNYIPYGEAIEPACQDSEGEHLAAYSSFIGSHSFHLLLPLVVHTLLNTFVWGLHRDLQSIRLRNCK